MTLDFSTNDLSHDYFHSSLCTWTTCDTGRIDCLAGVAIIVRIQTHLNIEAQFQAVEQPHEQRDIIVAWRESVAADPKVPRV